MAKQSQFLDVVDRDTAEARFRAAIELQSLGAESIPLDQALQRVLAADVTARVDVPSFDRSNVDGYAVRACDTYGALEEQPKTLRLLPEVIATAVQPRTEVGPGEAMTIATGGMMPRGADAVVMIEDTDVDQVAGEERPRLTVRRAVTPGRGLTFAGADIAQGEIVLRAGDRLSSRETGVLAAIGESEVLVCRRPRVAILSTGDEIIAPGQPMKPGFVYDSNARILADAVTECGGEPVSLGIAPDHLDLLRTKLHESIQQCDVVLLSGGTSKGEGDLCYRVVAELNDPGIVAHGVALKPGKPICLAATAGKPVVILPGFPTSAIFTFHEFVAPVIRLLSGAAADTPRGKTTARMAVQVQSEIGRTEYLLVGLAHRDEQDVLTAYPMGKGSGSVTTFSKADGFVVIDRNRERLEGGDLVGVQLFDREVSLADLHVVGSHCVGLDELLSQLQRNGHRCKSLVVGSTAGLAAAQRNECDLAGIHLLDPDSGLYNETLIGDEVELIRGYGRMQGIVFRPDDDRFVGADLETLKQQIKSSTDLLMVNRNRGSGTRALIDQWLGGQQPNGYAVQSRSHNAVAAAIAQGRADWGVAIEIAARRANLGFLPLAEEQFDFVTPRSRTKRPAIIEFRKLLQSPETIAMLQSMGFRVGQVETMNHREHRDHKEEDGES